METENRLAASGLNQELTSVRKFSFFQLSNLLSRFAVLHNQVHAQPVKVRYRAMPSLAFPPADVDHCAFIQDGRQQFLEVTVTFLGLFGPASPLPAFYTERIIQSNDPHNASRDLMDLFNHRAISLLQVCWEKYRYYCRYQRDGSDHYSRWLLGLLGVDRELLRRTTQLQWHRLLPYAGILFNNVCSADLLGRIVARYFDLGVVKVQPWVKRVISIPDDQCNQIGMDNCMLGEDCVLGNSLEDYAGKFSLHLELADDTAAERFLPDGPDFEALVQLVRFALKDPLDFDLHLHVQATEKQALALGHEAGARLGWNLSLGDVANDAIPKETVICVTDFTNF